jgi:hypothetical protein
MCREGCGEMRIESQNRRSFIELERYDEGGFLMLTASASIDDFTGRNSSIMVDDAPAFLREMASFEVSRRGAIALRGIAQEFELRIRATDRLGHLYVGVTIQRLHPLELEPLLFSGGFIYDAKHSAQLFADLREMLRDPS